MNQARSKTLRRVLLTLPAFAYVFGPCMGLARAVGQPEALNSASHSTRSGPPGIPRVRLTPMPGFNDDAAYIHFVTERVTRSVEQAEVEQTRGLQAKHLLAAANLILAFELEPVCSQRLLRIPVDPDEIDESRIRDALDRADELLARAETAVRVGNEADPLAESATRVQEHAQSLRAFSGALRAYLRAGRDNKGVEEIRQAASLLSRLMEQDDPRVVAAATFWQALLRSLEDDPDRALSVLELVLTDPPPDSMPYAFFSRLLRCRLIAQRGGVAAALALLLQLEERCLDWFSDDDERAAAIRVIQLERIHLMTDWREPLPTADAAAKRSWCRKRAVALTKEAFADPGDTVLRLTPAIPTLVEPLKPPAQLPAVPREGE